MTIPAHIDIVSVIQDLNRWGWFDLKIEVACGFSEGYITKLKQGRVVQMRYDRTARLYNLWCEESERARARSAASPGMDSGTRLQPIA